MKLSEAIRLGSLLRPQKLRGNLSTNGVPIGQITSWDQVTETCALTAALQAIGRVWRRCDGVMGGVRGDTVPGTMIIDYPASWMFVVPPCPVCAKSWRAVYNMVPHLNDDHEWTREQIADWVATVEPQETVELQETVEPQNGPSDLKSETFRDPLPLPQPMPLPKPFEPQPFEPHGSKETCKQLDL